MKKILIGLLLFWVSNFIFANGLILSSAEYLITDDAQFTFMPNSWAKTSYNKALFDMEFDDSLVSLGLAYKFPNMRIGFRLNSEYSFLYPRKSSTETTTEIINDDSTINKTTTITDHGKKFGQNNFFADGLLNIGFGNHFSIFLNLVNGKKINYTVPKSNITVKDENGTIIDSSSESESYLAVDNDNTFFGFALNFNAGNVFVKVLSGAQYNMDERERSSEYDIDDYTSRDYEYVKYRLDLGFEIPKEDDNHQIDLSVKFEPETNVFMSSIAVPVAGKNHYEYYSQILNLSSFEFSGDYVFTHPFNEFGVLSIGGGLEFTSNMYNPLVGKSGLYENKHHLNYENVFNSEKTETVTLIPVLKMALKYPLIQDKLFISLGSISNMSGLNKNVVTTYEKSNVIINNEKKTKIETSKKTVIDRLPVQPNFYGGLIFNVSNSFTIKSSLNFSSKDISTDKFDYSFNMQGTYKF